MAEKLLLYYKHISEVEGMIGKVKLAQLTKIPSTRAALEPDSHENIIIFRKAVETLTGKPAPSF